MKLGLVRGADKIRSYTLNYEVVYLELLGIANHTLWNVVWRRYDGADNTGRCRPIAAYHASRSA